MAERDEIEAPLISEEEVSSNEGRSDRLRPKGSRSKSDAISYGTRYQRAAALVDLAEDGIQLPMEVLDDIRFERAIRFYFIYTQLDLLWSLNLFALILLNFLETPLWCSKYGISACHDSDFFFLGQLPYLTSIHSIIYEGITLTILVLYTFFPISFEGYNLFWKNSINKMKVVLLAILLFDMLVYALYLSPALATSIPFRLAPYIRVVFLCLTIRELRSCFVILAGMAVKYFNTVALSLLFLLFSSWLAFIAFKGTCQGKEYFNSFGLTLYQMLVLFTKSNNPEVWVPAYKESRWSAVFFIIYVLLGVFFVTDLILAVIYDSFKTQVAKQVAEMDSRRKSILEKAFSLLDNHNLGYLKKEQCFHLLGELNKYRTLPKISKEDFDLIVDELDDSSDFKINTEEFADLCSAIVLKFQKEHSPSWFEHCPTFYHAPSCEKLKEFVQSRKFEYIILFVLIVNLVAIIIETTLDIEDSSQHRVWQKVELVFGWVYVIEMALKIFSLGFDKYWSNGENRFDFVVTWVIVIGETLSFCLASKLPFLANGDWLRYLLLARMLRLVRLLLHVRSYRVFLATFLTLISSLMPYLGTIFCFLCIYCSLGTQIFGGIVNAGNPALEATDLYINDFVFFNFNDYPNGMVTLFNLLMVDNWHIWMQSYWDLTGTSWTLLYFISFYLIAVLLLLHLIVSFVLESFFAELELEKSDEYEEHKGRHGGKIRIQLAGVKSRSKNVDLLLHHMLKSQLSETQGFKK